MRAKPVDHIHHNLHTGQVSVQAPPTPGQSRRVTLTAGWVEVTNATPHVSERGRQCMVRAGQRAVHAKVWGTVTAHGETTPSGTLRIPPNEGLPSVLPSTYYRCVRYNPFEGPDFRYTDTGETWTGSPRVIVALGMVWVPK